MFMLIFNVHGNFCMGVGWGVGWCGVGLITFNHLHSLIIRFEFPIVNSNPFLLLPYEHKNILTRS